MYNISNITDEEAVTNTNDSGSLYFVYINRYYTIHNIVNWSLLGIIFTSVIGNILILIVMSLPHNRRSSTAVFFTYLAVSDMILVLLLTLERWLHWVTKRSIYDLNIRALTLGKKILDYSVFQSSSWILVCVTIERVVGVLVPHKVKTICSRRSAFFMVNGTCLFILTVNTLAFTILVEITYDKMYGPSWENKVKDGTNIIQLWDFCMSFIIPLILISSGSIIIVLQLLRGSVQKSSRSKTNPVTLKLLAVNFVFIVTMLPFCIFAYLTLSIGNLNIDVNLQWLLSDFLLFVSDLNASLNFFVYCLTGSKFRSDVLRFICCRK